MKDRIKDLLPIGSVVRLNGANKCLMIFGVCQTHDDIHYDYIGVVWPEGNLGAETQIVFYHKDIEEVVFTGYDSEERQEFLGKLERFYEEHQ